jgi:hypothetical protein
LCCSSGTGRSLYGSVPHPDLDTLLPAAAVRTRHRRTAAVSPDALWDAARRIRLADTRALGRLVRWRIPGTPATQTYDGLFRSYPFTVLEEGEHHLVCGLCGRIWTLQRDYPALAGPDDFRTWAQPGTVRVLFAHWVEQRGDGRSELCSEARVDPVDRVAAVRLRALWVVIGRFEPLVAAEPLTLAARRAAGG